jgi:hypothetical protein
LGEGKLCREIAKNVSTGSFSKVDWRFAIVRCCPERDIAGVAFGARWLPAGDIGGEAGLVYYPKRQFGLRLLVEARHAAARNF